MAADDRELRDRLEQLQVRAKALRARLEDPTRLDLVRAEVGEQLERVKVEHAQALARFAQLRAEAEDARMRSMQAKRERAEADVPADFGSAGRLAIGIAATVGAGIAGVHFGAQFEGMRTVGAIACTAGACGFVAWVYRVAAELRGDESSRTRSQ